MHSSSPSRWYIVLFFVLVLLILLSLANLLVYQAVISIFVVTVSWQFTLLGTILFLMTGGFITSTVLGMMYSNKWIRMSSLATSIWMGFFVYLFSAMILYGFIAMLPVGALSLIGGVLLLIAIGVSIYGVIHARNIHIVEVTVPMKNLPTQWKNRRAIWVSDLHLGHIHTSAFTRKVVDTIKTIPYDILFIGGDLYDGTTTPDLVELIAPFKEIAEKGNVYFITGNHEEFRSADKFLNAVTSIGIQVLQDKKITVDEMQIIGVDYTTASDHDRFREILWGLLIDSDKASILLKHEPKDIDVAYDAGISLQISGHTHRAQLWPLSYIASLIYKRFAYGLQVTGKGRLMNVFTSSGVGTWGPPMRVGTNSEIVVFTFVDKQ